jgi:5-methylcytosine-specific restriction endonuclease McrA
MKTCNRCSVVKSESEFYKGRASCKACKKSDSQRHYADNKEAGRNTRKAYYEANREAFMDRVKRSREDNPDRHRKYARDGMARRVKTGQAAASCADRRTRLQNQSPVLSSMERLMVANYYSEAKRLTELTGVTHEVDHIIPLCQGGLHAPWNLQVLTQSDNRSKGGR